MVENISSLLLYPFEKGQLTYPDTKDKTLFWEVAPFSGATAFKNTDCVHSFKPYADSWDIDNTVGEVADASVYQNILCVLPKHKERSLYMLAQSLRMLDDNGLLLAVAPNDAGGKNIEKWMEMLGAEPLSLSKSKCRIVWAYKTKVNDQEIQKYIEAGQKQKIVIDGDSLITRPGIFGWNKIDKGSKILIDYLPSDLRGTGADFGCGYGYLSSQILKSPNKIQKLYALEADYNALECAQENLKQYEGKCSIEYSWIDLMQNKDVPINLDWIVMNPPFHDGKKMDSQIGLSFITTAAQALGKKGKLYLVANAHLPYEYHMKNLFFNIEKIYEGEGYKVFMAEK